MSMAAALLVLFVLLAFASAMGWVADSRDGADWAPTNHGDRAPKRP